MFAIYIWVFIALGFNVCMCFESTWFNFHSEVNDANREELVVTNVTTDKDFKVDYKVKKWTSLSVGPVCYSVGMMDTGLAILFSTLSADRNKFNFKTQVKDLNKKVLDVVLLKIRKEGQIEIILIVSFHEELQLVLYKIGEDELESLLIIPVQHPVTHINAFQIKERNLLLVANNSTVVNLYEFDVTGISPIYGIVQSLRLPSTTESSTFNNFEYDYYLSLTLKATDTLLVYKFHEHQFLPYKELKSKRISSMVSFEIGFKSFLAVDGLDAGIYQFTRNGLVKEKIINSNLDGIIYWLPIPATTYRDEVILLTQRVLDYGSHRGNVIDIITYNGGKFEEHEDILCFYFGELHNSLDCLAHDKGIIGSSYVSVDDKLALIVPNITDFSHLFIIHSAIRQVPDPKKKAIEELIGKRRNLEEMILTQSKKYEELKNLYKPFQKAQRPAYASQKETPSNRLLGDSQTKDLFQLNEKIEEIGLKIKEVNERVRKIVEKESRKEFNTIVINGRLKLEGKGKFISVEVDKIKGSPATELLEDIVRKDSSRKISGSKTFTDLEVDNISFKKVNDLNANEIVSKEDSAIFLNGNITFTSPVNIENVRLRTGKVNNILLEEEVVDVRRRQDDNLEFKRVKVEHFQADKINSLNLDSKNDNGGSSEFKVNVGLEDEFRTVFIPQNVSVSKINGEDLQDFLKQLCLVNIKCSFPDHVKIKGNIFVRNSTTAKYLNNLKFPEEYILRDSVHHLDITGEKTFKESLTAKDIRCRGTINGLDTKKLVTLSTNQEILGKNIFEDITVNETLNVTGKILGEDIEKFLPNPTLEDIDHIKSNVDFRNVEVEGEIIVENNFNANNLKMLLGDLIYKDEEVANITSHKYFPEGLTIHNNLEIKSNTINRINLNSFVTKDTDQVLDISFLKGDVTFDNLLINGTYGGTNITQLDRDLVKLTGEHYISSTLIFSKDIEAKNFEITETLNDLTADEYFYTDGNREFENNLEFEDVNVDNIFVKGDINGNLSEVGLNDFSDRYLSYSKDQVIDGSYFIKYSSVDNLNVDYVNNNSYEGLFNTEKLSKTVKNLLENDQLKIENLYVNGSIHIQQMNDRKMDDLLPKNIFLDENGKMRKNFSMQGDIYTDTIEIVKLSRVDWNEYIKQLVFKDEVDPVIKSPKLRFTQGIKVDKLIETEKLNDIPIENIFTKVGNQNIAGNVTIKGDVDFKENIEITEGINELKIDPILKYFSITNGTYVISGDTIFKRLPHIYNLRANGFVNSKNSSDVLSHLVYTDEDSVLHGETSFENIVNFTGNLAVQKINDITLSEVVPNIALTTKDTDIGGPITFSKPVIILNYLKIQEDLLTNTLYGCDLDEWVTNAKFIDKGLIYGNYTLENVVIRGNLKTKFVNDIDMNMVVPLRSNQSIEYLEFEEITIVNDVPVGNLVNGYNLPEEYKKTVMANVDQEILSDVIFKNVVLVRENLTVNLINDKDVSKIVTTDTDQNLTVVYNFNSKCNMHSDVHIDGLINGVNASMWLNNGIRIYSPEVQKVYDDWNVTKNLTFNENIEGQCIIDDMDLAVVTKDVEKQRNNKYKLEYDIISDYKNMCIDVTHLYKSAKTQIYKFKHLEKLQTLSFDDKVQYAYYFQYHNNHYLLVNNYNCSSQLLIFNRTAFHPISFTKTGHISEAISVRKEDDLHLITRSKKDDKICEVSGTNVWKFTENDLKFDHNMEPQDLLQESIVPATFYALNKKGVFEFKITEHGGSRKYRKWKLSEENAAFVPRGLKIGLALRTGHKIIFLDRTDPLVEDNFGDSTESVIIGNFTEIHNHFLPGWSNGNLVVTKVGTRSSKKSLLAVATHEETNVRGRWDFIKIYDDPLKGEIFHKVPAYKPSSLVSIEFGQGETLLAFMENQRTLQVYEYKGIEGFKHRSSSKIQGSKLFVMTLPVEPYLNERKIIGVIHENTIRIIQAVMLGNQIKDDLKCGL